jgi:NAD(P)-dependent dehydrogenase (short-subunit alcohol dehydrogenase family)
MRLSGKVAIVTGGGRGIGKAIAWRLAREGAKVMIGEMDSEAGTNAAKELVEQGFSVEFSESDVSDPNQARSLVQSALKAYGGLEILVNNAALAGYLFSGNLVELPLDRFQAMLKANLESVFLMSQAAATAMLPNRSGSIINISSIMYLLGAEGLSAYQVAKGAMVTLTRSLAIDLAPYGIIVNAIAPGYIDTRHNVESVKNPMWQKTFIDNGRIPLRRIGQPEEIASLALVLASSDCSYMTGQTLIVDGGLSLTLGTVP